jgi:hypothetical protein
MVEPAIGVGGGLYHLRVRGKEVTAPLTAATNSLWTPFLSAGAGLGLPFSAHWSLQIDVRAAFVRRSALVRVGDSEAGQAGWPLLVAAVALGYAR